MVRKQNLRNMHSIALSGERYIHGDTNSLKWMSKLQLPSLQKFRVKDLRLAVYKNLLLPTLTCLSITGDSQGMSVSTILSTLSALPRLETLELSGCVLIPDDRNGYRSGLQGREPKTVLTHLRSLSLEANLIECATLLSSLDVPMGTDLRMVLNGLYYKYRTNSKPLLMTEVLSPIQTFIQNVVSAHPLTKLAIRKTRRESIITERYEDYVTWRVAPEGSSSPSSQIMTISVPRSRIHLSRLEGDDGVRDALLGFLVSQDLASLQVEIPMMAADWKRKLGALVNVRRLWVTGADQEFIGALSSQGGAPLLFPRLQHLVIEEDGTCCFDEKFARNVSAGLKSRKAEKRQKLERLDVRCVQTWPHGPVKRLQGVVGTLTFLTPFRISELSMEETFDTEDEMSELEDSE
ncbi:hypothetical protein GLOTRDRAFT_131218 [Gloeophyllum trabeum ATCC 11539]|uniref:RNI-like protein n=1 Tax=Gloeophyllum trabeum (strain ATCC 11539 / FP-39264 / Madison 617) TaxID=670483 RepID=S7PZN6_GLOTA|nr:uncharacterized protein GLOTRDRAFT_131218 [Gloeophyllum trabeum ATCC 11539]EPQ52928.1 hypothetical protein GLOTRDRAFT_131218 [Gloeophyllum trabeum ATCC 11539]